MPPAATIGISCRVRHSFYSLDDLSDLIVMKLPVYEESALPCRLG